MGVCLKSIGLRLGRGWVSGLGPTNVADPKFAETAPESAGNIGPADIAAVPGGEMEKAEIPFLTAAELSRLIAGKEVSPVEATEAYLDRIDSLDFKFNAYLTVSRKHALTAAREAEQAIARGEYLGPLHGVPVAVKDQLWTAGIRTTAGSRFLADFVPEEDATVITKLKEAGAILLGKTNMTEFAIGNGFQRYSVPRNPWNLDVFTGSSSSGSGAATAAYLCATSLGEDTGGSIRFPAAWCGVVGLRPTWGRVSRHGLLTGVWSMDAVGPISRSVEDAAITLNAIAGHDPKDPYTWNTPVPDYTKSLDGNIRGMRVGIVKEHMEDEVTDSDVKGAVSRAASVLEGLGASVGEASIPLANHGLLLLAIHLGVEPALNHRQRIRYRLQDYLHGNRKGLITGSIMPAQAYYKAQKLREMTRRQVLEALQTWDVLVTPTMGRTAQEIEGYDRVSLLSRPYLFSGAFSLANTPAISVPCGFSAEGLPIGLQIGGRPGAEETVLKAAHAYERNTPWHTKRPPAAV